MTDFSTELRFHVAQPLAVMAQMRADGWENPERTHRVYETHDRLQSARVNVLVHSLVAHMNFHGCQVQYRQVLMLLWNELADLVDLSASMARGYDEALRRFEHWALVQRYNGPVSAWTGV